LALKAGWQSLVKRVILNKGVEVEVDRVSEGLLHFLEEKGFEVSWFVALLNVIDA